MAYNYIGLVNEVNRRLNEVELITSNFSSTSGFHSQVKDSVNAAIQEIDQEYPHWPYNFVVSFPTADGTSAILRVE